MNSTMSEIVFTPAALLDLLTQIEELEGKELGISETLDGKLQLVVGDSFYVIDTDRCATTVDAPDAVVSDVAEINEEAYSEISEDFSDIDDLDTEAIEGGIIKELAKTLLVGGVVRLGKDLLTD